MQSSEMSISPVLAFQEKEKKRGTPHTPNKTQASAFGQKLRRKPLRRLRYTCVRVCACDGGGRGAQSERERERRAAAAGQRALAPALRQRTDTTDCLYARRRPL